MIVATPIGPRSTPELNLMAGGMSTMSNDAKRQKIEEMYDVIRKGFAQVPEISAEDLRERLGSDDLVLVDVREPSEQAVSMIPGAITGRQFEEDQDKYRGQTVAVYCTIGGRSGHYARRLADDGWNVLNFRGSMLAWTHAGGELVDANGATNKVHTDSRKFDLVAEDYQAVW